MATNLDLEARFHSVDTPDMNPEVRYPDLPNFLRHLDGAKMQVREGAPGEASHAFLTLLVWGSDDSRTEMKVRFSSNHVVQLKVLRDLLSTGIEALEAAVKEADSFQHYMDMDELIKGTAP